MDELSELDSLRSEIDDIDTAIIELMARRQGTALRIAEIKNDNKLPIYTPSREREIYDKVAARFGGHTSNGFTLLYCILMDLHKYREYERYPKQITVPSGAGGATIRAIIPDTPFSLCRFLSPLSVSNVALISIHSQSMPGDKLIVDLELSGDTDDPSFAAALSVLSDTSEKFTIL